MPQPFTFYQDAKCTIWQRSHFTVTADCYDDAVEKLKALKGEDLAGDEYDSIEFLISEILFDTAEPLSPEENQGYATLETFSAENGYIAGNGESLI